MKKLVLMADPGSANGGGWFETEAVCDGEVVTQFVHGGYWSAVYAADGRHFIPVTQTITNDRDCTVTSGTWRSRDTRTRDLTSPAWSAFPRTSSGSRPPW